MLELHGKNIQLQSVFNNFMHILIDYIDYLIGSISQL